MKAKKTKILLTSFQTWLPHQKSNSSDDLLAEIENIDYSHHVSLSFLRNLPVDIELASKKAIAKIDEIQPDVIICCGMAERRDKLTIESNGSSQDECLYSSINLTDLTKRLIVTEVSHDAGKFVCEGLYYRVLKYIQTQENIHCIFVHVPLLENIDLNLLLRDFHFILLAVTYKLDLLTKADCKIKRK